MIDALMHAIHQHLTQHGYQAIISPGCEFTNTHVELTLTLADNTGLTEINLGLHHRDGAITIGLYKHTPPNANLNSYRAYVALTSLPLEHPRFFDQLLDAITQQRDKIIKLHQDFTHLAAELHKSWITPAEAIWYSAGTEE